MYSVPEEARKRKARMFPEWTNLRGIAATHTASAGLTQSVEG